MNEQELRELKDLEVIFFQCNFDRELAGSNLMSRYHWLSDRREQCDREELRRLEASIRGD